MGILGRDASLFLPSRQTGRRDLDIMLQDFNLTTIIARVIVLLIAFTIHELSHALTAD